MLRHFPLFIILLAELVENYKMNELIAVLLYYHPDRVYHPVLQGGQNIQVTNVVLLLNSGSPRCYFLSIDCHMAKV